MPRPLARFVARRWRLLAALAVAAAAAYLTFWVFIPSRWLTLGPGPAPDVATLVVPAPGAEGASRPAAPGGTGAAPGGRFLLTTVQAAAATPARFLEAIVREDVTVYPRSYLVPAGMDDETYGDWSKAAMAESQLAAAWQAFIFLGRPADLAADGGRVYWASGSSPARGRVEGGDVIVTWRLGDRGGRFVSTELFETQVRSAYAAAAGANVAPDLVLELLREGRPVTASLPLAAADLAEWPFLGLALGAENLRTDPPLPVSFPPGDIGGPSGGLMLALQIVDDFTPGDLPGGRVVAGSGTIGPGGTVGPVGGIGLKLRGAVAAGAAVFLVPDDDYPEAQAEASRLGLALRLIPVSSLAGAERALSTAAASGRKALPAIGYTSGRAAGPCEPGRRAAVSLTAKNTANYNGAGLATPATNAGAGRLGGRTDESRP